MRTHFRRDADGLEEVAPGIARLAQSIVNLYFLGPRHAATHEWLLVDCGLPGSAEQIARAAAARFGRDSRPYAILLTHGHFDHVGGLPDLAMRWNVPVYAHEMELPYLTGRSEYPPPDPTVGGGAMSILSRFYPRGPIDLGRRALPLPADQRVPGMPQWRWIPTPGHTPGHVSFFRESDGVLLAGDAFVTTKQESVIEALLQQPLVWRPPAYYTCDWQAARDSIERLAELHPQIAATGHGRPMQGEELQRGLSRLLGNWHAIVPQYGRYREEPAVADASGVRQLPPPAFDWYLAAGLGAVAASAGTLAWYLSRETRHRSVSSSLRSSARRTADVIQSGRSAARDLAARAVTAWRE
jgi:glyoxylase-like metal-dependent hydrolase (beta-lactamase superfamily II)